MDTLPALAHSDVLLYDGECRFCRAQVARLSHWVGVGLVPTPLQQQGVLAALGIPHEEAMRAMQLITTDGRICEGVEAVVVALRRRPIWGRLVRIYYVPGLRQLADLGYRLIARYRYYLMGRAIDAGQCPDGACAVHLHAARRSADANAGAQPKL